MNHPLPYIDYVNFALFLSVAPTGYTVNSPQCNVAPSDVAPLQYRPGEVAPMDE